MPIVVYRRDRTGREKRPPLPDLAPRVHSGIATFVNADIIAQGLGRIPTGESNFEAGRIMIERLENSRPRMQISHLKRRWRADRSHVGLPNLAEDRGYICAPAVSLVAEPADVDRAESEIAFAAAAIIIPDGDVRRRYDRGCGTSFGLYRPIADLWRFFDNHGPGRPRLVASGVT